MSDVLTAAAAALNVPEELVKRSAEARAAASGSSVDEILAAWAGGGASPPAAPTPPAAAAPPAPAETHAVAAPAAPPEEAAAVATLEAPEPETPVPPTVTEAEEVTARPLGDRSRVAGRFGSWSGVVVGFLLVLAASPWLAPRASLTGTEGSFRPAVDVVAGWTFFSVLVLLAVFGAAVAVFSRAGAGWLGPEYRLAGTWRSSAAVGAAGGLVGGALVGGLLVSAFALEGTDGVVTVPIVTGTIVMIVGTALTGRAVAALVQAMGVPLGVPTENPEEVTEVRRLLGAAISLPVAGMITILALVLPAAWLFLSVSGFAPLLTLFLAIWIL